MKKKMGKMIGLNDGVDERCRWVKKGSGMLVVMEKEMSDAGGRLGFEWFKTMC